MVDRNAGRSDIKLWPTRLLNSVNSPMVLSCARDAICERPTGGWLHFYKRRECSLFTTGLPRDPPTQPQPPPAREQHPCRWWGEGLTLARLYRPSRRSGGRLRGVSSHGASLARSYKKRCVRRKHSLYQSPGEETRRARRAGVRGAATQNQLLLSERYTPSLHPSPDADPVRMTVTSSRIDGPSAAKRPRLCATAGKLM